MPNPNSSDPPLRPTHHWSAVAMAGILIAGIGGMTAWFVQRLDAQRPKVGDMIVFTPTSPDTDQWFLTVATGAVSGRRADLGPCVFDPNAMAADGGSLIIESREDVSPPKFRLHWAGRRTSEGQGDCGPAADVTLGRSDLQRLANAAGGFGVRPGLNRKTATP